MLRASVAIVIVLVASGCQERSRTSPSAGVCIAEGGVATAELERWIAAGAPAAEAERLVDRQLGAANQLGESGCVDGNSRRQLLASARSIRQQWLETHGARVAASDSLDRVWLELRLAWTRLFVLVDDWSDFGSALANRFATSPVGEVFDNGLSLFAIIVVFVLMRRFIRQHAEATLRKDVIAGALAIVGVIVLNRLELVSAMPGSDMMLDFVQVILVANLIYRIIVHATRAAHEDMRSVFASSTRRLCAWYILQWGVRHVIDALTLQGVLYQWTSYILSVVLVVLLIFILRNWRTPVTLWLAFRETAGIASRLESRAHRWHGPLALLRTPVGILLWAYRAVRSTVLSQLDRSEAGQRLLAKLARRDQNVQPEDEDERLKAKRAALAWFNQHAQSKAELRLIKKSEKEMLADCAYAPRGYTVLLMGEAGSGKSSVLRELVPPSEDVVYVTASMADDSVAVRLCERLETEPESLTAALGALSCVVVECGSQLVLPRIGGLAGVDQLSTLIEAAPSSVSWVVEMRTPSAHYLNRARRDRHLFDETINITNLDDKDTTQLINEVCAGYGIQVDYSRAFRRLGENPERDYMRQLWDVSGGNLSEILRVWRRSLERYDDSFIATHPTAPPVTELETFSDVAWFFMRTLHQLRRADSRLIAECASLTAQDVSSLARALLRRKFINLEDDMYSINPTYARSIQVFLERKALIPRV